MWRMLFLLKMSEWPQGTGTRTGAPVRKLVLLRLFQRIAHSHTCSQFDAVLLLVLSVDANSALYNRTAYVNATLMNVSKPLQTFSVIQYLCEMWIAMLAYHQCNLCILNVLL